MQFKDLASASEAIKKMDGKELPDDEGTLSVVQFKSSQERQSVPLFNNLYVKSFPDGWTSEDLNKMFEPFGEILSASVMVDNEGKSKGFGFVCFKDPASA